MARKGLAKSWLKAIASRTFEQGSSTYTPGEKEPFSDESHGRAPTPSLDSRTMVLLTISLVAMVSSALFFHETGNRLLTQGILLGQIVHARALSCAANIIGVVIGFALTAVGSHRFSLLRRRLSFWIAFFVAQTVLVVVFYLTFQPLGPCEGTLFVQLASGASLAVFLTACMGFSRQCSFAQFRTLMIASIVLTTAMTYGVFSIVASVLPFYGSLLVQIALTILGAVCFLYATRRSSAIANEVDSLYDATEDAPFSFTPSRPLFYFVLILISYGVVFGFLHVIPLGLYTYQLPRVLPNLIGAAVAMALFAATVPKSEPSTTLVWNRIYRISFPFVTLAALLIPYTSANEFVSSLSFAESAQFFFIALLITGCFAVCRTTGVGYAPVLSWALLLYDLGFLAGDIAASIFHDAAPLNDHTFGLVGIGVFLLLTIVTFNTNGEKYAKTAWGILPKETPKALYAKRIIQRCEALADAHGLTARERETLLLLAQGKRPKEISEIRTVSITTVRSQVQGVYSKLGVHSSDELSQLVREKN